MNNIKISVVIPIYNVEKYLNVCLESILVQTFTNFEVLCIDDGSQDNSKQVLQDYANKDSRIIFLQNEKNLGAGLTRNKGLDNAKGDYVIFCDADDTYAPYALQVLYDAIVKYDADISGGNLIHMDYNLRCIISPIAKVNAVIFKSQKCVNPREDSALWLPIYHQRFLFSKKFLLKQNIRYPDVFPGEDPVFLAHAFCHTEKVALCPEVTYYYRGTDHNKKMRSSAKAYQDHAEHFETCYNIYKEHGALQGASFFIYQALQYILDIRTWLPVKEKKIYIKVIENLSKKDEFLVCEHDFSPYCIDKEDVKNSVRLLLRYPKLYSIIALWKFISPKLYSFFRKIF